MATTVFDLPMLSLLARAMPAAAAAAIAFAAAPALAPAATAVPDIDYDLDGSPPPDPPSLGRLDLYMPDGAVAGDRRPVVVYVHGGAWRVGDKANKIASKVALFTGAGYGFASVNYRLSPNPIDPGYPADRVRFPDHPDDVAEAVAWIDRNVAAWGGDPSRLILIGHSAGAQIVALLATDPAYVKRWGLKPRQILGTIPLDGEYDIPQRIATGTFSSRLNFYNGFATPAENAVDDAWRLASPITWAESGDPPFLVVTQQNAPVRAAAAGRMVDALGDDATLLAVPYDHEGINAAVGSASDPAGETDAIMGFIRGVVADARAVRVKFLARPGNRVRLARGGRAARAKVRWRFAARRGAARFECRLDGARFRRCNSPVTRRVTRGRHAFRVRAKAANGRPGPVAVDRFRVVG